ncbi:DUF5719 family protein [Herbiconiux sp. SYSU D00978]|uniref:DUF5719 family protein n=1 Tax=Herbiconiux sp. SYSU D00978 TaxID=2812562 RepID=UPI001A96DF2C|nr:DUF5719 family protein [Herbiconiux sp. SYSU D00978]
MTDPRTRRRHALRVAAISAALVLAGGAVAGASFAPLPEYSVTADGILVEPVATTQQRACPGPMLTVGADGAVSSSGTPATLFAATSGEVTNGSLSATQNSTGTLPAVGALAPVDAASQLAGSQTETLTGEEQAGLAVAACQEGSGDAWLVGGATTTGRTTVLTLANPSQVPATVDLDLYGEGGPITAPGTEGISVAAGSQRVLSLAGFAPDVVSPVVHVSSRGGSVVADLQQTTVRTLEAGGVDLIGPSAPPATDAVIPGVVLGQVAAVENRLGEEGYGDLAPTLRLLATGGQPTTVSVTVVPEDPNLAGAVFDVPLEAGVVFDLPVEGLAEGAYAIELTADTPFVAAMRVATADDAGVNDFAWSTTTETLGDTTLAVLAPGEGAALRLANPADVPATVTVAAPGGTSSVEVPAGGAVGVPVEASAAYTLTGTEGLHAAASYGTPAKAGWLALGRPAPGSSPITVYPVPR